MATRVAWTLNLDADVELATRGPYTPSRRVLEAMAPHAVVLAQRILSPLDIVVDAASEPGVARGYVGRAFSPTPRALAILTRAGATPAAHSDVDVLRCVSSRAFCAALGQTLPGAIFATRMDDALAVLARAPPIGTAWRLKRAFGMAGRGQRVVLGDGPSDAERSFIRAGLDEGGVQIEPHVAIESELTIHGIVERDGTLTLGPILCQRCDARGQWLSTSPLLAGAVDVAITESLSLEARLAASALTAAGYFGPFGVDAFTYAGRDGVVEFQPRSEINARYSMGFPYDVLRVGNADDTGGGT